MAPQDIHPMELKQRADEVLEKATQELKELLQDAAAQINPFPLFPGTPTKAIEAEPAEWDPSQRGCIVVRPDGQMSELVMNAYANTDGSLFPIDDLREPNFSPLEYIIYAYGGIQELAKLMMERRKQARSV